MTQPTPIPREGHQPPLLQDLFSCASGAAMGVDWTGVREELTEAIPPAYSEHIGRAFLASRTAWVAA